MASVEPVVGMIAYELSRKLDLPGLRFDFKGLWAHDMRARSASFVKLMATDGMEIDRALSLSGLPLTAGDGSQ